MGETWHVVSRASPRVGDVLAFQVGMPLAMRFQRLHFVTGLIETAGVDEI
jgi:hypothetical protein